MERLTSNPRPEAALVVVAKAPRVGQVKTRLCPPLSQQQAAQLYTGFLLDTIELALQVPECEVKVVCPTAQDAHELRQLLPPQVGYIVQTEAGLTAALTTAFAHCLAEGYRKVLCISSDNPTLPAAYLSQALQLLDETAVVLGPSEDGGYYLIGASANHPQLFSDMIWSTNTVLDETLQRADQEKLATALLPLWYDLDTGQELARFVGELTQTEAGARHTRAAWAAVETTASGGEIEFS